MDPNQVTLNTFLQFLQNANNLQNSNFQVPFYPHNQNLQTFQFPFPFQNPPIKTTSTPFFQSHTQFGSSTSKSTNVGGSPDPMSQTLDSQNFNKDGLDAINLDDDDQVKDDEQDNSHWRWEEDKLVISAWLNVSKDSVVITNQKDDAFWSRSCQYYKENNSGLIKRRTIKMKKRWHRINVGAQGFDGCYDQASQRIGSGSNNDNTMELAHQLYQTRYQKKKRNFVQHWLELQR